MRMVANPVTADQARQKAAQFLGERVARARGSAPVGIDLNMSAVGRDDSYYIFNVGNKEGFVVVSGEDATEEILGYSDTGSIDSESMPCNMQMLFDMYAEQIQYVRENGLKRDDVARGRRMTSDGYPQSYTIAESRRSRFDQFEPYNDLCPLENAPSGCVATAMAGLMYAYQWPHTTIAKIPSYWDGPFTYINGSPENTAIEWTNILPQYGYRDQVAQPVSPYYIPYDNIPEASKNAIATLMRIAGTSVETNYDDDGSGADVPDVPSALTRYFNYDGSVVFAYRKDNADNWKSALKNELLYHGPVIYRGDDSEGDGHAFLIEGWENDKFIINFGWSGDGNGKFLLEVAETDGQIISYLNEQGAVFNVKPRGDDQIEVAHLDLLNADIDNHTISGEYLSGRMSLHNLKDYSTRAFTLSLMDQETGATKHITPNKSIPPDGTYHFDFRFTKLVIGHHYVLTANYYSGVPFFTSVELTCMEEPTFDPDDIIPGNDDLVAYEYWFDGDVDNRKTVGMNSNAAVIRDAIDTRSLSDGLHWFNFRLKRADGKYSPISSSPFMNMKGRREGEIEYWFDDDYNNHNSTPIADTEEEQEVALDLDNLEKFPLGLHTLNMRVATPGQNFSSIYTAHVLKMATGGPTKLEYWVDDDFSHRQTVTYDASTSYSHNYVFNNTAFDLSKVSQGVHRIYYRTINDNLHPLSAVSMTPVLVKSMYQPDASGAKILGYSISVDGKEAKTREFTSPRSELVMEHVLDARDLTTGTHRVKAKIWNSAYAGVSVEQQFSVLAPTVPTLTLVAEEHDGLVSLRFDAVPNDLRYRTVRVDANGAKAKVDGKEGSSYPGTVAYTDNPAAGTYTYYVQTAYTDYLGEQHSLKSNEVTVTVTETPAQEVVAEEFGYITGRIVCDKNTPTYGLKVHFSDGVTTNVVTTAFARTRIPVGTVLTLTVTGDDTHEYEPATVTVAAGANNVTLQGTLIEENHVSNLQNDLAVCSPLKLTVMDGRHHVKFSVKNLSHENDWQGTISLKAIDKKKADKNGLDVATMGYEEKNLYVGESFSLEIGYNATKEVDIFIKGLKLKQDTEFYLYLESTGSFLTSNLSPLTSHLTKPLAVVSSAELAENPAVVTIGRTDGEPAGWNKDYAERFAYLMLGVSSLLDGVSGPAGDLSLFYDIGLAMAKEITGKRNAKEAISDWLTWLSGKPVVEVIDNPTISNAISAIYGIYTTIGPTYAQKYWKDILGASWDYASAQLMMGNLITIGQAVTTDDPIEATLLCSSMVYSLFYSGTAAPYASMMYSYMVVGQSLVNKVLQFASIMRGRYIVTRLKANKPYSGSDEGRQNTAVDFKLVVKTKNLIGSSKIDFTKVAASRQVKSISIKVAHQKGQQQAEFSFNPVFQDDGIMLKTDGNGITNSQLLDDQNDISEFYMEINWANGRQTLIPLNEEADGIDISFKGTDPQGIDHFEDFKPLVYTITLTTATGKDNIPDELYLGSNKKRQ